MSAPYAYPNNSDMEGIFSFFRYVNNATDGTFMTMIICIIGIITFIAGRSQTAPVAFLMATFLTSVLSAIATILGLVSPKVMYLSLILTALGAVWIKLTNR